MKGVIRIYRRPKLKRPLLIATWPGMGNVALRAGLYLKEQLKAQKLGQINSSDFFHPREVIVEENLINLPKFPQSTFYYWKNPAQKSDLVIFIGEAQPDSGKEYEYAQMVLDVAERLGVEMVCTFAAMPVPISHTKKSGVWAVATNNKLIENLKSFQVNIMSEGHISGMNGLLLGVAKEKGLEGICLLGEIPLYAVQIENPRASCAVLEVLLQKLEIKVNMEGLHILAERVEREIDKFVGYLKEAGEARPLSEEDIEKIKKGLQVYTKIPESARERIEKLFEEAKRDISKAGQLKSELDKWDIYKEYEDRFLSLFKKDNNKKDN